MSILREQRRDQPKNYTKCVLTGIYFDAIYKWKTSFCHKRIFFIIPKFKLKVNIWIFNRPTDKPLFYIYFAKTGPKNIFILNLWELFVKIRDKDNFNSFNCNTRKRKELIYLLGLEELRDWLFYFYFMKVWSKKLALHVI